MTFQRSSSLTDIDDIPSLSGSFKEASPMQRHRKHNSTVAAMLSSNLMRDCVQVHDMYNHCIESKNDKTAICKTAKQYFASCAKGEN